MNRASRLLLLCSFAAISLQHVAAKDILTAQPMLSEEQESVEPAVVPAPKTAGEKKPFIIKRGDCELAVGGKVRIEHFFQRNMSLLNEDIPDEFEFFKHTVDLSLGFNYGKETYCHPAVEALAVLRTKNIWGKPANVADKDASGSVGPANVVVADSLLKPHAHTTGKPLIWLKEGWLQFSFNAIFGCCPTRNPHTIKLGFFPFELGRGIALGSCYGLNREAIALYSYVEDKGAPGILLHGNIIDNCLSYDLYYAKFEERSKGFNDTINLEKAHFVGRSDSPWRGINKDDEAFAARLKWKAIDDCCVGKVEIEPYVFYNAASDQKVEIAPDAKANWGSYGVALEHTYKGFEWGGEVAFNYGRELLYNIDRNQAQIVNDGSGDIVERYNKVKDTVANADASVTKQNKEIVLANRLSPDGKTLLKPDGTSSSLQNKDDRFRDQYKNKLRGWMGVLDAAYTIAPCNLKVATAFGYASGDVNPHTDEKTKTYHGFVGLHEVYCGKRVKSVALLDERLLKRPATLNKNVTASTDMAFSDLMHAGIGATWTPKCCVKDLLFNPNALFFWKVKDINKITFEGQNETYKATTTDQKANNFMGTELNLLSKCTLLPDLCLFVNFAVFLPGQFFSDMKGVPLAGDFFDKIAEDPRNDLEKEDITDFRLSDDTAFHLNIGFEFKF